MACQIKMSVKVVKQGVDVLQVPSSDPALCDCSSWPEKLSIRHERQAGTVHGQPATLMLRGIKTCNTQE